MNLNRSSGCYWEVLLIANWKWRFAKYSNNISPEIVISAEIIIMTVVGCVLELERVIRNIVTSSQSIITNICYYTYLRPFENKLLPNPLFWFIFQNVLTQSSSRKKYYALKNEGLLSCYKYYYINWSCFLPVSRVSIWSRGAPFNKRSTCLINTLLVVAVGWSSPKSE